MKIHDLNNYKVAKQVLPHLEAILRVLNLTEKSLTYYRNYTPVASILFKIKEQKSIVEAYKNSYTQIKASKGEK